MSAVRVLVCFKVTPDFEALREADWAAAATQGVQTRYVRRVLNCFDESALELALGLSDAAARLGVTVELGALSIGGREVDPYLKTLVALGYERAARVAAGADGDIADTDAAAAGVGAAAGAAGVDGAGLDRAASGLDFAPAVVASIIASYVLRADHSDLLVLGCRSGPGDGGTVPFRVAEALGWPCLTRVTSIEPLGDGRLRVGAMVDDGLLRVTLRPPCVLAVGNALVSHLRAPTLKDRLERRERRIDVLAAADLGLDIAAELRREACVPTALETIDRRRRGAVIAGATPRDKARTLFDSYLSDLIETL
jgi:electron transfer flavoprotein alpha/beta subunit